VGVFVTCRPAVVGCKIPCSFERAGSSPAPRKQVIVVPLLKRGAKSLNIGKKTLVPYEQSSLVSTDYLRCQQEECSSRPILGIKKSQNRRSICFGSFFCLSSSRCMFKFKNFTDIDVVFIKLYWEFDLLVTDRDMKIMALQLWLMYT